jgi:arylsulfatase A-like enzyme
MKPNFVFIITDQQRADHAACYGNTVLKTPNIDRIAANGTRFDRYYVSSPICTPNRATLLTGRLPSVNGARTNGVPLPNYSTTFVDLLRAAGWRTAVVGKMHLQQMTPWEPVQEPADMRPGQITPPPEFAEARMPITQYGGYDEENIVMWRDDPTHHISTPYYGFDYVKICLMHGDAVYGDYGRWLEERHPGSDKLRGPANALPSNISVPYGYRTRVPEESYPTAYVTSEAIAYLENRKASEDDRPFYLKVSYPDPHHPFTPPGKYFDMYDPDAIPLPESFRDDEHPLSPGLALLRKQRDEDDRNLDSMFGMAISAQEAREAIALTYGQIAMIDDGVGQILDTLERLGLGQDTIVIYTSDHGDYMGDHQLLTKGPLHYQGLIRIPLIWNDPIEGARRESTDALCSSLDLAETILDRAGLQDFHGMQGKSLMPVIRAENETVNESVLIEDENQQRLLGFPKHGRVRTLLTKRWRMTLFDQTRDWCEMYDLEKDPLELRNLWEDSGHLRRRADLLEEMARKMMDYDDRSPFPTSRS